MDASDRVAGGCLVPATSCGGLMLTEWLADEY
jgi:hypothetical protein